MESTPKDATHWSTRSMAKEVSLTQSAVHRIWRAFGLAPHRQDTWKLSKGPQFVAKVRTSLGSIWTHPSARSCSVWMRSHKFRRLTGPRRSCRCSPVRQLARPMATHDYKRAGTSSLYAALDIATGQVIGSLHSRHRAVQFKKFLNTIDREVPKHLDLHLVLDN